MPGKRNQCDRPQSHCCLQRLAQDCQIYGLNSYGLKLEAAVAEARLARPQPSAKGQNLPHPSPAQIIKKVYRPGDTPPPDNGQEFSSFEQMFRTVVSQQPAVAAAVEV